MCLSWGLSDMQEAAQRGSGGTKPPSVKVPMGREGDVLEEERGGGCGWNRVSKNTEMAV